MFKFENIGVMEVLAVIAFVGAFVLMGFGKLNAEAGTGILSAIYIALGTFRRVEKGQQIKADCKAGTIEASGQPPAP